MFTDNMHLICKKSVSHLLKFTLNLTFSSVADRTLSLLYSGAKNVMNNNTVERMETGFEVQKVKAANTLHQMCLTAQGTLARPQPFSKVG